MPRLCSPEAPEISSIKTLMLRIALAISAIMAPLFSAISTPSLTLIAALATSSLISFAEEALRWASVRTSLATTANPRPDSPARAASTAAFNARILV